MPRHPVPPSAPIPRPHRRRRQAAAHYRAALDHADRYEPAEVADLSEEFAIEAYTIGSALDAVVAQSEVIAVRRQLGDPLRLGASLRWLSRFQWFGGRRADAEDSAREASEVLADAGDRSMHAMACLLYTSPSPRDGLLSRMPSSA